MQKCSVWVHCIQERQEARSRRSLHPHKAVLHVPQHRHNNIGRKQRTSLGKTFLENVQRPDCRKLLQTARVVTSSPFEELNQVLHSAFKTKGKTIILGGDFNAKGIVWDPQVLTDKCNHPTLCEALIDLANSNGLTLLQRTPTREQSILDLYFTNKPSLVKCHETISGISDHHMVVVDSEIVPP